MRWMKQAQCNIREMASEGQGKTFREDKSHMGIPSPRPAREHKTNGPPMKHRRPVLRMSRSSVFAEYRHRDGRYHVGMQGNLHRRVANGLERTLGQADR